MCEIRYDADSGVVAPHSTLLYPSTQPAIQFSADRKQEPIPNRLGPILKEYRERRNLTIGAVAARAGVAKSSLSAWEADRCVPRGVELGRVLEFLGTSYDERLRVFWTLDRPKIWAELGFPGQPGIGYLPSALRRLRQRAGFSLSEVASRVGLSREAVAKWERGDSSPSESLKPAISVAFGLRTDASSLLFADCPWSESIWIQLATADRPPSRDKVASQISFNPDLALLQIVGARYIVAVRMNTKPNWKELHEFLGESLVRPT